MSPAPKPGWRRAFDRVERVVGEPLEGIVASPKYVDVMLTGLKVQRALLGAVGRAAGGVVRKGLRAAQIPTRTDVRTLNQQLTELATEVRQLSAETHRLRAAAKRAPGSAPRKAGGKRASEPAPRRARDGDGGADRG